MSQTAEQANTRTIGQVVVKTIITHTFAVTSFAQICDLLNIPKQHNARIYRIFIFLLLPSIALGQFALSLLEGLLHLFHHLIDAEDLTNIEIDRQQLSFFLYGTAGVYIADTEAKKDDEGGAAGMASSNNGSGNISGTLKLINVVDTHHVTPKHTSWTWVRFGRIFGTLLALTQAVGSIVVYVRRVNHGADIGIDGRNFWMAVAASASTGLSLPLLLKGDRWVFRQTENDGAITTTTYSMNLGQGWRIPLETILGAIFPEIFYMSELDSYRSDILPYSMYDTAIGIELGAGMIAIIIFTLLLATALILRKKGPSRLRAAARLTKMISVIMLGIAFLWTLLDAVVLFVTDVDGLVHMIDYEDWRGTLWSDPLEETIPVI